MQNYNLQKFEDKNINNFSWFCDSSFCIKAINADFAENDYKETRLSFSDWKNNLQIDIDVSLISLDKIFCPIKVEEEWSLAVISIQEKSFKFFFYDDTSKNKLTQKHYLACILLWIQTELGMVDKYVFEEILINNFPSVADSGVVLLMNAYHLLTNKPLKFDEKDCLNFRNKIGIDILRFYTK
jgi:Ulp1 family protease